MGESKKQPIESALVLEKNEITFLREKMKAVFWFYCAVWWVVSSWSVVVFCLTCLNLSVISWCEYITKGEEKTQIYLLPIITGM